MSGGDRSTGRLCKVFSGPVRWRLVAAVCALAVASVVHMVLPWFLGRIVDEGLLAGDRGALIGWSVGLFGVSLLNPLFYVMGYRQMGLAEAEVERRLAEELASALTVSRRPGRVSRAPGDVVTLLSTDGRDVAALCSTVGHGVMNVVAFTLGTVMVWRIDPVLGGVLLVGVVAATGIAGPLLGRLTGHQQGYRSELAELGRQANDLVSGLRVLRGIGGEGQFLARYTAQSKSLRGAAHRMTVSGTWVQALQQAVPLAYLAVITWVGARLAVAGSISVGDLSAAFGYATGLLMYSGSLLGNAQQLVAARVGASRLAHALAPRTPDGPEAPAGHDRSSAVDVVLADLPVSQGMLTVVVTDHPAGVSGIFHHIARSPYEASRLLAGHGDVAPLRVLVVDDGDHLFAGSLRDVVNTPDDTAAQRALSVACAEDVVVRGGAGLDGWVAEGGRNLSGGQRQRLALARAVAADPDVLLAVDPTVALDAVTEAEVARRLARCRRGRTTVVVSPSTVWRRHADRVVEWGPLPATKRGEAR
ncbi:ABC-type multidrug transport system, ATPase and permease component [Kytococcus aerolatus]|uniref:ABC-type multidrug transport system, ATPase and permease component n=1 Tax=Kytococcus aerolatus TaxID=592308 RepID=A0A212TFJ2_9MICO|nr:ABC transporter ATP-binding protein [Kytococcus aerolatus]SNC64792.1 ABC-type multidrug transport system, ATPase and permease component [Kytococcus aerolatus]